MTPLTPLRHAHHCVYDLHYHFVFVVKYRRALLRPDVESERVRLSHEVAQRYEFEIETLGADLNHVHLLCSAPPKVAPSEIVRIYKSITTVQMLRALPELKKELWGGKLWTGGFYVSIVGQRGGYGALIRYIQNQGKRPAKPGQKARGGEHMALVLDGRRGPGRAVIPVGLSPSEIHYARRRRSRWAPPLPLCRARI